MSDHLSITSQFYKKSYMKSNLCVFSKNATFLITSKVIHIVYHFNGYLYVFWNSSIIFSVSFNTIFLTF